MNVPPTAAFTYHRLPGDIHELILHTASPEALEECMQQLKLILHETPEDKPILLLSDIRQSGVPPIGQLWQTVRQLFEIYPQHPAIHDAILHHLDGKFYKSFLVLMQLLADISHAKVSLFEHDQRDQALAWLREQSSTNSDVSIVS